MQIVLHETSQGYEKEYQRVRGTLVLNGSSLNAWLEEQGIERRLAYRALKGQSLGRKAVALRIRILKEILAKSA